MLSLFLPINTLQTVNMISVRVPDQSAGDVVAAPALPRHASRLKECSQHRPLHGH